MKKWAYYNENDLLAAAWIRELMKAGLIAEGEIDERSIVDVRPDDVRNFCQCHWFAGIAVWSYALRRAGWPDDRPVWTASCPCPPFSVAGKKKPCPECGGAKPLPHAFRTGFFRCTHCGHDWHADGRHLWPELYRLVKELGPVLLLGEQVAGRDGLAWSDIVQATLELEGYAVGRVPFASCGVGAPHIRQRLYWVADAAFNGNGAFDRQPGSGLQREKQAGGCCIPVGLADMHSGGLDRERLHILEGQSRQADAEAARSGGSLRLADTLPTGRPQGRTGTGGGQIAGRGGFGGLDIPNRAGLAHVAAQGQGKGRTVGWPSPPRRLENPEHDRREVGNQEWPGASPTLPPGENGWLDNAIGNGCGTRRNHDFDDDRQQPGAALHSGGLEHPGGIGRERGQTPAPGHINDGSTPERPESEHGPGVASTHRLSEHGPGPVNGHWGNADWLFCRDGKWRPVEPGTFPLAHGAAARVGRLRGYGNAINALQAEAFIRAYMEAAQ